MTNEIKNKTAKTWPKIKREFALSLGCDPELFLKKDGAIVGSEKLIPADGIPISGTIIRDGIQVELNPTSNYCREILSYNVFQQLQHLFDRAKKAGMEFDMSVTVPITQKEMDSLSPKSKMFGCTASYNVYDGDAGVGVPDGSKFLSRSAGGHIHLGAGGDDSEPYKKKLHKVLQDARTIVPLFDIIVANTFVMIDRDKGNITRRQTYGRAGEFRLPSYGIEYRTLSNYWLNSYTLLSMAFGLIRQAVTIAYSSTEKNNYVEHIMSLVNIDDVRAAINYNNYELALSNFNKIKDFVVSISPDDAWNPFTISSRTIAGLEKIFNNPDKDFFEKKVYKVSDGYKLTEKEVPSSVVGKWLASYSQYNREGAENFLVRIGQSEVTS